MRLLLRKIQTLFNIIKFHLIEKKYKGVKYLYYKVGADRLLISFSALPPTDFRVYNNVKGFDGLFIDRLYIKDTWGYRGSYYLYENGENRPFLKTCALIDKILDDNNYKEIVMVGTSKGGASSIIFGLKYHASDIIAGACQYHLGDYLAVPAHEEIFNRMRGENSRERFIHVLNEVMPAIIKQNSNCKTVVHLVYSKKEHTYSMHIKDLIEDLKSNSIKVVEKEEFFENHNDVGYYFIPYVKRWINKAVIS